MPAGVGWIDPIDTPSLSAQCIAPVFGTPTSTQPPANVALTGPPLATHRA